MQVQEIMSTAVECCTPGDTAQRAASFMRDADAGAIPVIASKDNPTVIGVVTDRDLCMDVVAAGRDPHQVHVQQCMTREVVTCRPDDDTDIVADMMAEKQIRRVPVVNEDNTIVGIVSLSDIARSATSAAEVGEILNDILEPSPEPSLPRAEDKTR